MLWRHFVPDKHSRVLLKGSKGKALGFSKKQVHWSNTPKPSKYETGGVGGTPFLQVQILTGSKGQLGFPILCGIVPNAKEVRPNGTRPWAGALRVDRGRTLTC